MQIITLEWRTGDRIRQYFGDDRRPLIIGTDPQSDIPLESRSKQAIQVEVYLDEGTSWLMNRSAGPVTLWYGQHPVHVGPRGRARIIVGAELCIDGQSVRVADITTLPDAWREWTTMALECDTCANCVADITAHTCPYCGSSLAFARSVTSTPPGRKGRSEMHRRPDHLETGSPFPPPVFDAAQVPVTLIFGLLYRDMGTPLALLGYVMLFGLAWDVFYDRAQRRR